MRSAPELRQGIADDRRLRARTMDRRARAAINNIIAETEELCGNGTSQFRRSAQMSHRVSKLRNKALACVKVADRTADNKLAAALLAYACG